MSSDAPLRAAPLAALLAACAPTPDLHPTFGDAGLLAHGTPLSPDARAQLRGVYRVDRGAERFGQTLTVDTRAGSVSLFGSPGAIYAVTDAACLDGGARLVLEGAWRVATDSIAGLARLDVGPPEAARALCEGRPTAETLTLTGSWGNGAVLPDAPLVIQRERPLAPVAGRFLVVAHRGGCRTLDDCGASENSVAVVRRAESLGANAIEVDVQLTADGVPLVYHDDAFSPRLVQGAYCTGPVRNFTLAHVRTLCALRRGEPVPTLASLLDAAVRETTLELVWLDLKDPEAVLPAMRVARAALDLARAAGRSVEVLVGLPDEDIERAYLAARATVDVPCLAEPSLDVARRAGCTVWAPRWTLGPQSDLVRQAQAEGRRVIPWTLDEPAYIDLFLGSAARPNGLLTNRPGLVLHHDQTGPARRVPSP